MYALAGEPVCTSVCRARDEGWRRRGWELIASGRDDCFSRDYADAYRYARAHVSANIDGRKHARAYSQARGTE